VDLLGEPAAGRVQFFVFSNGGRTWSGTAPSAWP